MTSDILKEERRARNARRRAEKPRLRGRPITGADGSVLIRVRGRKSNGWQMSLWVQPVPFDGREGGPGCHWVHMVKGGFVFWSFYMRSWRRKDMPYNIRAFLERNHFLRWWLQYAEIRQNRWDTQQKVNELVRGGESFSIEYPHPDIWLVGGTVVQQCQFNPVIRISRPDGQTQEIRL